MNYTQTLNSELNESVQALELQRSYGNVAKYLDIIHDLMNIHHLLQAWSFDRSSAAKLIGSIYVKNYDFYKEIRSIPGVIRLPFSKAPDHVLISNLSLQLCYLKEKLRNMSENECTDILTIHTCNLLFDMFEHEQYAS